MPKRVDAIRLDASEVQGDGAWVELRKLKWREMKELPKRLAHVANTEDDYTAEMERLLIEHLVAWNWCNERGEPLPVPKTSAEFDDLTSDEIKFLSGAIENVVSGAVTRKN